MRIWIDCEFNSFRGALISMALVSEDGEEFYRVLPCLEPHPWVAANVMPVLGQAPVTEAVFQEELQLWLRSFGAIHVIADWPEDIQHFCQALITGPGTRIATPLLTMEVRRDLDAASLQPHNALADARAIRARHLILETAATRAGDR